MDKVLKLGNNFIEIDLSSGGAINRVSEKNNSLCIEISTIGELRESIKDCNDNDIVVVEIHEGIRREDLYNFYVDKIDGITDSENGGHISEIRFCI